MKTKIIMKGYYDLPKPVQWIVAVILLLIGFGIWMPFLKGTYGLLVLPFLAPFLNFVTVPIFRLIGYYKYLNPYVLSTVQNDKKYDLHNIFSFDYFVNFRWSDRGRKAQRILLGHYFKALLTIIDRIEKKQLAPEVKIVGNSYFFSDRTAEKLGFTVSDASLFWKFNSILQFIELSCLYSFSRGKFEIPKFWKVKCAEIEGSKLLTKKALLESLTKKLLVDLC